MKAWSVFLKERSPVVAMLLICGFIAASTQFLLRDGIGWTAFTIVVVYLSVFLTLLRIMDEIKDVEKDRQIHPERPLARGLIAVDEARRVVVMALVALAVLGVGAGWVSQAGSVLMLLTVAYGFLIYKEFWVGEALGRNIFVFGITHQLIVLPMYLSAVAMASPTEWNGTRGWAYAWLSLGCSFSLEMSRKLDPASPALARTYAQVHGRGATFVANLLCLGVIVAASLQLGLSGLMIPLASLQLGALLVYLSRPSSHRLAAGFSVLTSLGQLLGPCLQHWLGWGGAS